MQNSTVRWHESEAALVVSHGEPVRYARKIASHAGDWLRKLWSVRSYHALFLALAIPFGILFLFLTPPYSGYDEQAHMYRVYQLSQRHLLGEKLSPGRGGAVPESLRKVAELYHVSFILGLRQVGLSRFRADWGLNLNSAKTVPVHFENTALYSPANYIPQIATVEIMRHLEVSPLPLLYMTRISGFVVWLILSYWAIKLVPHRKAFFTVVLLLPSSIYFATTVTADTFVIGLSALIVAMVVKAYDKRQLPSRRFLVVFYLLAAWLALCKQPYWLASLAIVPLLVRYRPKGNKKYLAGLGAAVLSIVILSAAWLMLAQTTFSPYRSDIPIRPTQQEKYAITHPISFSAAVGETYLTGKSDYIVRELIGRFGAALLPNWITIVGVIILFVSLFQDEQKSDSRSSIYFRFLCISIVLIICLAISALMYASWSAVGATYVDGIQGRYFVPVLFLLGASTIGSRLMRVSGMASGRPILAVSALLLVSALCSQLQYSYHLLH